MKGKEFFVNNELRFPDHGVEPAIYAKDRTYKTVFGPAVTHDGVIYAESDNNVRLALRRLFCVREPEKPHHHERLILAQKKFIKNNPKIFDELAEWYESAFLLYTNLLDECREHHADPHDKRLLRIQAYQELIETGILARRLWINYVTYKFKKAETAKPAKFGRMIGDLGVAASLQGFRVTNYMKHAMVDLPFEYNGVTMFFCATPTHAILVWVFKQLLNPPTRAFAAYFSDDSCFAFHTPNGVMQCNVDISGCDASHTPELFASLVKSTPPQGRDDMRVCVEQCALPIKVNKVARRGEPRIRAKFKADGPTLYSGSTLTTALNNLATLLIFISIAMGDTLQSFDDVIRGAARAGYIVTCDICTQFEDLQFLKHSPVYDTAGVLHPLLNLGVLLRATGVCHGDLPGRGPIPDRARAFQRALLNGLYPNARFTLADAMKTAAGTNTTAVATLAIAKLLGYKVVPDNYITPFFLSDASVYKRYRLRDDEITALQQHLGSACFEEHYCSSATRKILAIDYKLGDLPAAPPRALG